MSTVQCVGEVTAADDLAARWRTTKEAAPFLGMSERVLRDTMTERARSVGDIIEARFDGIVGRKVGRRWKVWLGEKWLSPEGDGRAKKSGAMMPPAENAGHGGKESPHGRA